MSEELKACQICGKPGIEVWDPEEDIVKCSDPDGMCHNALYPMYLNEWQSRPIEDELNARIAELESVIKGMFPMWVASMAYCEHGKKDDLLRMRNYYNGRDNPLTEKEIHLMFSLIGEVKDE